MIDTFLYSMLSRLACGNFFGLVPWNQYLNGGACGDVRLTPAEIIPSIPLIALAVLDSLLRIAGVAAVFFVIYGGVQYVTSQGSPDATKNAQNTVVNALVGVIIAILAVATVSYIGRTLGA